jgi:hypothetical protein
MDRDRLIKRLRWYWPMEASNALVLPGVFMLAASVLKEPLTALSWAAMAGASGLLLIGGLAWRAASPWGWALPPLA